MKHPIDPKIDCVFKALLGAEDSGYYGYTYTYATDGRFTNMSALLFTTSTLVFLIGLVSEKVTQLGFPLKPGHLMCPLAERSRSEQADWLRLRSANSHVVPSKTGSPQLMYRHNESYHNR